MAKDTAEALLALATNVLGAPEVTGTIPQRVLSECLGIAVLRVNKRAIVSASKTAGSGVLVVKTHTGEWSAPAFIKIVHSDARGLLTQVRAGTDIILVLNSYHAVDVFHSDLALILGDAVPTSPGPLGDAAQSSCAVHAYGRSASGFVMPVDANSTLLAPKTKCNARCYGAKSVSMSEILGSHVTAPPLYAPLHRVLCRYVGTAAPPPAYVGREERPPRPPLPRSMSDMRQSSAPVSPVKRLDSSPPARPPPYYPMRPAHTLLRHMHTMPSRPAPMTDLGLQSHSMPNLPAPPVPRRPSKEELVVEARALFDYDPIEEDELPLARGETVKVLYLTPHKEAWWLGQLPCGRTGRFPANYVDVASAA